MDRIAAAFFAHQCAAGLALAADSDVLELTPIGPPPVQRYLAHFDCATLVRQDDGTVAEARGFVVGLSLPSHYLDHVHPMEVASWLHPVACEPVLPHVAPPLICLGHIAPGTPLVELLLQVHEIGRGAKMTMVESNALNRSACVWARANQHRYPVDRRPLRRRALDFTLEERP